MPNICRHIFLSSGEALAVMTTLRNLFQASFALLSKGYPPTAHSYLNILFIRYVWYFDKCQIFEKLMWHVWQDNIPESTIFRSMCSWFEWLQLQCVHTLYQNELKVTKHSCDENTSKLIIFVHQTLFYRAVKKIYWFYRKILKTPIFPWQQTTKQLIIQLKICT